jgi:hypothetical protein
MVVVVGARAHCTHTVLRDVSFIKYSDEYSYNSHYNRALGLQIHYWGVAPRPWIHRCTLVTCGNTRIWAPYRYVRGLLPAYR